MGPEGSAPQVVAYEYDGDGVRWSSCSDDTIYRSLLPVSDGVVYVSSYSNGASVDVVALDAATVEPPVFPDPTPKDRTSGDVPKHPLDGRCHRWGDATEELDETLRWDRTECVDRENVTFGFDPPRERHVVGFTRDGRCDDRSTGQTSESTGGHHQHRYATFLVQVGQLDVAGLDH